MKRPSKLMRICVFLILGAIVNVAVAWGCCNGWASNAPAKGPAPLERLTESDSKWFHDVGWQGIDDIDEPERVTTVSGTCMRVLYFRAWHVREMDLIADCSAGATKAQAIEYARLIIARILVAQRWVVGWPLPTMQFARWQDPNRDQAVRDIAARGISQDPSAPQFALKVVQQMALPPLDRIGVPQAIWPGFAINTVFYAVVLWLLFAAPFALRRRRRIKRGLCPKCAYDLRGSEAAVCPECGAMAVRPAQAAR